MLVDSLLGWCAGGEVILLAIVWMVRPPHSP
jgi:hypothetical protein